MPGKPMWVILQMDHLKRLGRNWPAEVRYGFELSESKSCPEVFIRLEVFSQCLGWSVVWCLSAELLCLPLSHFSLLLL